MKETFLLGTYTKRTSKGIYSINLDTKSKKLENLTEVARTENPTYLAFYDQYLFAVSKNETNGGVIIYHEQQEKFIPIAQVFVENAVPCYIAYNPITHTILTANYHDATTRVYRFINQELSFLSERLENTSSIHPNQTKAHLHFTNYTPDNKFIVSCNLGGDTVLTYQLNTQATLELVASYHAIPGSGPRHLVFHPTLPIAYLICELSASIEILNYTAQTGEFTRLTSVPLFNQNQVVHNWASAIRISKDGNFLYASNRETDVLVVFSINQINGHLTKIQTIATEGKVARDFNFNQDQSFIIVGHQESDTLTLFERNHQTGLLTLLQKNIFAPEVICILPK